MSRLPISFFSRSTLTVARESLGKKLVKIELDGTRISGTIVEVEGYIGEADLACHASVGLTQRTQILYGKPGTLYIYLIYGMHWMLNLVTEPEGFPAAILIRALFPTGGTNVMKERRNSSVSELTNGPAKLAQAFGMNKSWNGYNTCAPNSKLFLANAPLRENMVTIYSPRKGIHNTPEPWRSLPWNLTTQLELSEKVYI